MISKPEHNNYNKLKVCFIQPVQSPYWTERFRSLAKRDDMEITLLLERASFEHRPGWSVEKIPGVVVDVVDSVITPTVIKHKDIGYQVNGVRTIPWKFSRYLMQRRPDIVVVCNATQLLLALPAKLLCTFSLALIVEDTPHANRNLPWFRLLIKKILYRRADNWFAFSDDARIFLGSIGIHNKIHDTGWSIDTDKFSPDRSTNKTKSGVKKISYVGALIERKGVLLLVRAWHKVPSSVREGYNLVLAGSGPLLRNIQSYIHDNSIDDVILLGQINYSEVARLLNESFLFVLPTLEDLCSLTVLEALASGCPVITTPYNGARDLVEHGENGWIADPLNDDEMARVLEQALLTEPDRWQKMADSARQRALARDNKIIMAQFADQLLSIGGRDESA